MPKLTREQAQKWTKDLPQGWKFDAQRYVMWGEKEIFTDSPENEKGVFYRLTLEYRAETENAGYFRRETGRQIPTASISRYTPTGSGMFSVVHILTENAADPESKRNYNALVKLAATIDSAEYFRRAAEKDTGKQYNDFSDFCGVIEDAAENSDSDAENPAQEPETETAQEPENAADNVTLAPEESACVWDENGDTVTEDAPTLEESADTVTETAPEESAQEEAQEQEQTEPEAIKEETAPDMFATLAAAYFAGKTVKSSKPRKMEKEPPKVEEAEPETVEEEQPYTIGWAENNNDSWKLSEEERKSLFCGFPVVRKERYNNGTWFSVAYSERVRMVYNVHSYDERDNINPGRDASFCGFMIDGNIYSSDIRTIDAKYTEDINRYLLEHVKSETDAAHIAANIESEYERGKLEELKERDFYDEAKRLFFDHKKPLLVLYWKNNDRETHGYDAIINYLLEPEKAVETAALRYMCEKPQNIYSAWIKYNRLSATFDRINSDNENTEHKLRRISESISNQKTVRMLLSNDKTVKCEADAVKRIPYSNYISDWDIPAQDRQYLPKDENGRTRHICAADIVEISHGGRILYSA